MAEFMLLMHGDYAASSEENWQPYLDQLIAAGALRGGSALGGGVCMRRAGAVSGITGHLVGYVKIEAADLEQAKQLVFGNPVYEAGGTVEIRALPETD